MGVFINDGHDGVYFIAEDARLYPAVRVHGRRMDAVESGRAFKMISKQASAQDAASETRAYMKLIADRIDLIEAFEDGEWKSVAQRITITELKRLVPKLWWRIRDIIMGVEAPDEDETGGSSPANTPEEAAKN